MEIGIPKEIAAEERRVALTPVGVYALAQKGHNVYVQNGAGEASGFTDQDFREVGAQIVYSGEELFHRAQLITKIQPPTEVETKFLDSDKIVYSFLNLGTTSKPILALLMERGVTALGYELSEQNDGLLPILTAMSEIAGVVLPQIAGKLLESREGGRGITLAGVAGIPPSNVVILGAGAVGVNAARAFTQLGAQVMIMDRDVEKLRQIDQMMQKQISTSIVTPLLVERAVRFADVLIGAILIRGKKAPHLVTEAMVKNMKPGSVIIDVSIDQGGCIETSRPTTLSSPTYMLHGVTHYCVPNIPSSVARTASHALNNSVLPWVQQVAKLGLESAIKKFLCLQTGIYLYKGQCASKSLCDLFDLPFKSLET
jgi:alanine dehydrogenase